MGGCVGCSDGSGPCHTSFAYSDAWAHNYTVYQPYILTNDNKPVTLERSLRRRYQGRGGVSPEEAVIVICDDNFAANQHMIADGHRMSTSNVAPMADANMVADLQLGVEALVAVAGDDFQPKAFAGREVFSHGNTGEPTQMSSRPNVELLDTQLARQHLVTQKPKWTPG